MRSLILSYHMQLDRLENGGFPAKHAYAHPLLVH